MITMTGDELLDIPEHGLGIADPEHVVTRRVFDILNARNRCGELACEFDRHLKISLAMEYQRRYLQRRQNCRDINLAVKLQDRSQCARAARQPLPPSELSNGGRF